MDYGGTSDPYCILEVGDEIIETTAKQKTLNPRWDESFSFPIATGKEVNNFRTINSLTENLNFDSSL